MNQFKYTLWALAFILVVDLLLPYVSGSKPFKLFGKKGFLLKLLSHGTAFVTLLSFYYALVALEDTRQSGEEQGKSLAKQQQALDSTQRALQTMVRLAEDQRKLAVQSGGALDKLTKTATNQQAVLSRQLTMSGQHLDFLIKQNNRKPSFVFGFGNINEQRLNPGDTLILMKVANGVYGVQLTVKNVGDAAGLRPVLLVSVDNELVRVSERVSESDGVRPSYYSSTTFANDGISQFADAGVEYVYEMRFTPPPAVRTFRADFRLTTINGPQHSKVIILRIP